MFYLKIIILAILVYFNLVSPFDFNFPSLPVSEEFQLDSVPYDDRIVGGHEANIEDFPHQVVFTVKNSYLCGGFIVSENYILTAAQCVMRVHPRDVVLRAGSTNRKNGTIIPIAELIPHPEYDDPAIDKDVALMRTVNPIKYTDTIQPVKLPELNRTMVSDTMVQVSGWGRTEGGNSSVPENLMAVEIYVVARYKCQLVYNDLLTDNEWCAGNFFFGRQGICWGDSGGAAIQDGLAVGIVSYARGCARPLSPSVFTDVAAPPIREFIEQHSGL
ncbi:trypsin-3-like [Helicoverpa zea]|uniref:trypsin-3-like n=1 Tax=Helicoverpa zea TaxID=7113 RepID=UPI001F580C65|nr:trypsin-3-like [Helicoverpa zea]